MTGLATGIAGLMGKYLDDGSYELVEVHGISRGRKKKSLSRNCIRNECDLTGSYALTRLLERVEPEDFTRDLQRLKEAKPSKKKQEL
jgi:GDP-D-mannose dehydratase